MWHDFTRISAQRQKVKKQADQCATGTAQKTVGLRSLRKFIVPNISLDDQIEIVNKLDDTSQEVIRLEEIYQRKLKALAELKQSILQKAFTGQLT
jgi:type I restriction enzyme, S subunit